MTSTQSRLEGDRSVYYTLKKVINKIIREKKVIYNRIKNNEESALEASQISCCIIYIYIEITNNKLTQIERCQTYQQTNLIWKTTGQFIKPWRIINKIIWEINAIYKRIKTMRNMCLNLHKLFVLWYIYWNYEVQTYSNWDESYSSSTQSQLVYYRWNHFDLQNFMRKYQTNMRNECNV